MFQINKNNLKDFLFRYKNWISLLLVFLIVTFAGMATYRSCTGVDQKDQIAAGEEYYTCAMHPSVRKDKPGNCPICGMRLIKKTAEPDHKEHEPVPEDLRAISISPMKQVLANVATTEAKEKDLTKTIRTVAIVAFDQSLFVAQQEYLSALRIARLSRRSGDDGSRKQGTNFLRAVTERLKLMGISDLELNELKRTRTLDRSLYFPKPGGDVWINAEVYEFERQWIRTGEVVDVTVDAYPAEVFQGNILAITPMVDPIARTFKVRVRLPKPDKTLSPDMFAHAQLKIPFGKKLAIPASSVIDTGVRKTVWVQIETDRFAPRQVHLGARVDNDYIVLHGIKEGDKVVSQGGFLLDSEAELRSFGGTEEGMPAGHQH